MTYQLRFLAPLIALCLWAGGGLANTVTVTLEANSGALKVSGRLISADPQGYQVDTPAGVVTLKPDVVTCTGRACPVSEADKRQVVPEQMQRIELSSLDREIKVKGALRGVSEDRFIVEVPNIGLVSLQRKGLRCSGPGCRATVEMITQVSTPVQIVGSGYLVNKVLPPMLTSYATALDVEPRLEWFSSNTYSLELGGTGDTVFVGGTGTTAAFSAFVNGAADIIVTGRQPNDVEVAMLEAQGLADPRGSAFEAVIAHDNLSVVTHPDIGVSQVRVDQLAQIFQGQINNWSELGGPDEPIIRVIRDPDTDESMIFSQFVFGGPPPAFLRGALIAASQDEVIEIVSGNRFAIGYAWESASDQVAQIKLYGSCGLPHETTPFARDAGEILMGTQVYLYAKNEEDALLANDLTAFLTNGGPVGDGSALWETDTSPSRIVQTTSRVVAEDLSGPRAEVAAQLNDVLPRWDRLSTTFRLAGDGETLDPETQHEMDKLITYLADVPDDVAVALAGFAPEATDFDSGLQKSLSPAMMIAAALKTAGGEALGDRQILPVGFGDLAPVACNNDPAGRQLNQRVEVWLRNAQP